MLADITNTDLYTIHLWLGDDDLHEMAPEDREFAATKSVPSKAAAFEAASNLLSSPEFAAVTHVHICVHSIADPCECCMAAENEDGE